MPTHSYADTKAALGRRLLHAANSPLRIRILEELAREPASAKTLSQTLGIPLQNISYHLSGVLFEQCHLIERVAQFARRGAIESVYGLRSEGYATLALIALIDALADVPQRSQPGISCAASWHAFSVDDEGRKELERAMSELVATAETVERRCSDLRNATGQDALIAVTRVVMAPSTAESDL